MPADALPSTGSAPAHPAWLGKYRVLLPIGYGGMSTVYLGASEGPAGFRREVALKWVAASVPGFPDLAAHLLREARIVGKIRHPHVVQMIDAVESLEGIYLVMEYVEGGTLAALAAAALATGAPLPLPIALCALCEALSGLHAAHELCDAQGRHLELVHRDFSPQNILVGVHGELKLGDFGIAKVEHTSHRTRTGIVKGTVSYMSPEQVRGRPLDRRSDVWSAGVLAWELFAGRPFHEQREAIAAAMSTLTGKIPRLRSVRADLPEALDETVAWALTRAPAKRCPSALELRERLLATAGVAPATTDELASYAQAAFATQLNARRARIELGHVPEPPAPHRVLDANDAVPLPAGRARSRFILVLGAAALLVASGVMWRARQRAAAEAVTPRVSLPQPQGARSSLPASSAGQVGPALAPVSSETAAVPAHAPLGARAAPKGKVNSGLSPVHPASDASAVNPAVPPLADNPYARTRADSK